MKIPLAFAAISALLALTSAGPPREYDNDGGRNRNDMDRRPPGGAGGDGPRDGPMDDGDGPRDGDMGPRDGGMGPRDDMERPPHVWTFAVNRNNPPLAFMDRERGRVVGLGVDMITLACQAAQQECEFIFLREEAMHLCFNDETGSSPGLWNRWWDGCVNFAVTMDRAFVNGFSRSYAREPPSELYVRNNDNLIADDLRREDNELPVGYVERTLRNPDCLMHSLSLAVNMEQARGYESEEELIEALRGGEVRVGFMPRQPEDMNLFRQLDTGDMEPRCAVRGPAVMTRKNDRALLGWLDRALEHVISSPGYSRVCYIWEEITGMPTYCVEEGMGAPPGNPGMGGGPGGRMDQRPNGGSDGGRE